MGLEVAGAGLGVVESAAVAVDVGLGEGDAVGEVVGLALELGGAVLQGVDAGVEVVGCPDERLGAAEDDGRFVAGAGGDGGEPAGVAGGAYAVKFGDGRLVGGDWCDEGAGDAKITPISVAPMRPS